jgi:hypothetical protein
VFGGAEAGAVKHCSSSPDPDVQLRKTSPVPHWQLFKGIVSRDWAGLQMGSLDRSEFPTIPLEVYF